jgi:hypothetical protein
VHLAPETMELRGPDFRAIRAVYKFGGQDFKELYLIDNLRLIIISSCCTPVKKIVLSPQGLKPQNQCGVAARLKPCPLKSLFPKHVFGQCRASGARPLLNVSPPLTRWASHFRRYAARNRIHVARFSFLAKSKARTMSKALSFGSQTRKQKCCSLNSPSEITKSKIQNA